MKSVAMGLALAALVGLTPAVAKDKRADTGSKADMQAAENSGTGGLKEWPVSKTEADWSSAAAPSSSGASSGTSSSGASSGTSGSDSGKADQK